MATKSTQSLAMCVQTWTAGFTRSIGLVSFSLSGQNDHLSETQGYPTMGKLNFYSWHRDQGFARLGILWQFKKHHLRAWPATMDQLSVANGMFQSNGWLPDHAAESAWGWSDPKGNGAGHLISGKETAWLCSLLSQDHHSDRHDLSTSNCIILKVITNSAASAAITSLSNFTNPLHHFVS